MKKIGRKKNRPETEASKRADSADPDNSFYARQSSEAPLDEPAGGSVGGSVHRTSRHTPVRRRENSNRASQKEVTVLLLKVFLIPVVLGVGFVGLKLITSYLEEPSEKDRESWEANSKQMERGAQGAGTPAAQTAGLSGDGRAEELGPFLNRMAQADRLLRSAEALEERGMNEKAIARFQEVLRVAPENFSAQKQLLEVYLQMGNDVQAVPLCLRLLEQDGMNPELQKNLLTALNESDRTESSLLLAKRILEREPENADVMEIAAYAHAAKGDNDKALELYKKILQRDPDRLLALEGAGTIYDWQNQPQQALPYYMQLVRLDPQPRYYNALARSYARQDESGKAVIFMGQAAGLYGESAVIPWLSDSDFDAIRETIDFRSFADQVAGVKTRARLKQLRMQRKLDAPRPEPVELKLPSKNDLKMLRPRKR